MPRRKFNLTWKQGLAEIVLIFVGITLAIMFQNFNEDRKDNKLRQGYYQRLLKEIRQDSTDLRGITGYNLARQETISKFFEYLNDNPVPNPDSVQYAVQYISYHMNSYVPNENTYKELISTGNIKLMETNIREKLLRLSQMHAYVDDTEELFNLRYDDRRNQLAEVIDEASFYDILENPKPRLVRWQRDINSEGFKRYSNLLAARLQIGATLIDMYRSLGRQCDELIDLIEKEIQ